MNFSYIKLCFLCNHSLFVKSRYYNRHN